VEEAISTGITTPLPSSQAETQGRVADASSNKKRPSSSLEEIKEEDEATDAGQDRPSSSKESTNSKDNEAAHSSKSKKKQKNQAEMPSLPPLPLNIIDDTLKRSASTSSTAHARNVCLVNRRAYRNCQGTLHRIVALRSIAEFQAFVQNFVNGREGEPKQHVIARQDALESLYINNMPKDIVKSNACGAYFTLVLINARNLKTCHFEEHWSDTNW